MRKTGHGWVVMCVLLAGGLVLGWWLGGMAAGGSGEAGGRGAGTLEVTGLPGETNVPQVEPRPQKRDEEKVVRNGSAAAADPFGRVQGSLPRVERPQGGARVAGKVVTSKGVPLEGVLVALVLKDAVEGADKAPFGTGGGLEGKLLEEAWARHWKRSRTLEAVTDAGGLAVFEGLPEDAVVTLEGAWKEGWEIDRREFPWSGMAAGGSFTLIAHVLHRVEIRVLHDDGSVPPVAEISFEKARSQEVGISGGGGVSTYKISEHARWTPEIPVLDLPEDTESLYASVPKSERYGRTDPFRSGEVKVDLTNPPLGPIELRVPAIRGLEITVRDVPGVIPAKASLYIWRTKAPSVPEPNSRPYGHGRVYDGDIEIPHGYRFADELDRGRNVVMLEQFGRVIAHEFVEIGEGVQSLELVPTPFGAEELVRAEVLSSRGERLSGATFSWVTDDGKSLDWHGCEVHSTEDGFYMLLRPKPGEDGHRPNPTGLAVSHPAQGTMLCPVDSATRSLQAKFGAVGSITVTVDGFDSLPMPELWSADVWMENARGEVWSRHLDSGQELRSGNAGPLGPARPGEWTFGPMQCGHWKVTLLRSTGYVFEDFQRDFEVVDVTVRPGSSRVVIRAPVLRRLVVNAVPSEADMRLSLIKPSEFNPYRWGYSSKLERGTGESWSAEGVAEGDYYLISGTRFMRLTVAGDTVLEWKPLHWDALYAWFHESDQALMATGLRPQDTIVGINGRDFAGEEDPLKRVASATGKTEFAVLRDWKRVTVHADAELIKERFRADRLTLKLTILPDAPDHGGGR